MVQCHRKSQNPSKYHLVFIKYNKATFPFVCSCVVYALWVLLDIDIISGALP